MADPRYPYTYACDYVRAIAGYGNDGMKLSRSDSSMVRLGFATALGMDDGEMARKLADYYKANEDALMKRGVEELLAAQEEALRRENGHG